MQHQKVRCMSRFFKQIVLTHKQNRQKFWIE